MTAIGQALLRDPRFAAELAKHEGDTLAEVVVELQRDPKASTPDFADALAKLQAKADQRKPPEPQPAPAPKGKVTP